MSNPYELRFKVLEMARDLCMDEYHTVANAFWQIHGKIEEHLSLPIGSDSALVLRDMLDELVSVTPSMPTTDQINAKAKELYEFVETKN